MTANGAPDVVEVMSDSDSDSDDIMVMEDVSWVKLGKKVDARAVIERVRREAGATEAGAARDARMEAAARAAAAVKAEGARAPPAPPPARAPAAPAPQARAGEGAHNISTNAAPAAAAPAAAAPAAAAPAADAENDPDVAIVGGTAFQGALNDFPHARALCATLKFNATPPAAACPNCFCFVCEAPAPCDLWGDGERADEDHCLAEETVPAWKAKRDARRRADAAANGNGGNGGGGVNVDDAAFQPPPFAPPPPRADDDDSDGEEERQDLGHILDSLKVADATEETDVPRGTLKVDLMRHQKRALAWAKKREATARCRGGVLADDQGLGKTISTLAIIVSCPPPDPPVAGARPHVMRWRRGAGDLGRDRGGRRTTRESFEAEIRGGEGGWGGGNARTPGPAARGGVATTTTTTPTPATTPPALPHLPSCICKECKQKRRLQKSAARDEATRRRERLAFGDSDDEEGQLARERHRRREAIRAADREGARDESARRRNAGIGGVGANRVPARTLVVCPAIVAQQWKDETEEKSNLRAVIYHGASKNFLDETSLLAHDVVVTTYGTVAAEYAKWTLTKELTPLFNVRWFRVVLDEAHIVRNRRTNSSVAVAHLQCERRWCLSGTPLMNGADDVYSLFRFLRYQPFASWNHFRLTISNPCRKVRNPAAQLEGFKCLRVALRAVALRRTKQITIDGAPIVVLPPRTIEVKEVEFDESERDFYRALEEGTQALFDKYVKRGWKRNYMHILVLLLKLRQACDHPLLLKEARFGDQDGGAGEDGAGALTRDELLAELGVARVRELERNIEECEQCPICKDAVDDAAATGPCGHGPMCLTCLRAALHASAQATGAERGCCPMCLEPVDDAEGGRGVLNLRALEAAVDARADAARRDADAGGLDPRHDEAKEAMARVLARAAELGRRRRAGGGGEDGRDDAADADADADDAAAAAAPEIANSAKIRAVLEQLDATRAAAPVVDGRRTRPEQTVLFSQFTTFLDIVGPKIEDAGHSVLRLDGTQGLPKRAAIVQAFRRGEATVLLVSLKAASLGLNLNCANNVILVDPWWNAAIEDQAIDRCHRIGQTKEVKVTRLIVSESVELRIQALQERKRAIFNAALGDGAESLRAMRQQLSLRDLQDLFGRRVQGAAGAAGDADAAIKCRCAPGRCMTCACVTLDTKCTPACRCGGMCANGNEEGAPPAARAAVGPFGAEPRPRRVKREPRR